QLDPAALDQQQEEPPGGLAQAALGEHGLDDRLALLGGDGGMCEHAPELAVVGQERRRLPQILPPPGSHALRAGDVEAGAGITPRAGAEGALHARSSLAFLRSIMSKGPFLRWSAPGSEGACLKSAAG